VQAGDDRRPDMAVVNLSLAAMKQVRDILTGDLPFDEDVVRATDSALATSPPGAATAGTCGARIPRLRLSL
jgi:hypothetical protein